MGFIITPEYETGVYVHREYGWLIYVESVCWIMDCEVFYKKFQRKPKRCIIDMLLEFERIGEL